MSIPELQTTSIITLAGRCLSVAMALIIMASCTGGDPEEPDPTATVHVQPTATATAELIQPPTPADRSTEPDEVTVEDGYIPDGELVSPFDNRHPAITNLELNLLQAVRQAADDAAREGIDLYVTSGWRSARYQQFLLDQAILTYGSEVEARKWVNTPEQSTHVTGNAIDIGPMEAYIWLSEHGSAYGLCQIYDNELWHYEFSTVPGGTCPPPQPDASAGS